MDKEDVKVLTNSILTIGGRVNNRYGSLNVMDWSDLYNFEDNVICIDTDTQYKRFKPNTEINIDVVTHNCVFRKPRDIWERIFNITHDTRTQEQRNRFYGPNEYYLQDITITKPGNYVFSIANLVDLPVRSLLRNRDGYLRRDIFNETKNKI